MAAELVMVDQMMNMIIWTKLFLQEQGYDIGKENVIYPDNKSAILLERNGNQSSGKQTRALNICYFFITDQVNIKIMYCPTSNTTGDYMTKSLRGVKYRNFCNIIMGRKKLPDIIIKENFES